MSRILLRIGDLFPAIVRLRFVRRPNRFVVHAANRRGAPVTCFMPNPGRLWELLFPGAGILAADHGPESGRRHRYTVLAIERDGAPVFLHTHVNNLVAETLLREGLVPRLRGAAVERREVRVGRSRFDFLLRRPNGTPVLVEAKSCTLFGNGVAMFPDAVTERGRRHIEELAALSGEGYETAAVFVVHSHAVNRFMPDYHTDPAFTRTLLAARRSLKILPVAVHWSAALELHDDARLLPVPWRYVARESGDRGHFLLALTVGDGAALPAGHYLAAGWADQGLDRLLSDCLKPPKRSREPAVALCREAESVRVIPIRASKQDAAFAPEALAFGTEVAGAAARWGAALAVCREAPFGTPAFHRFIERWRMRGPGGK